MPRIRLTALARFPLRNVGALTAAIGACLVLGTAVADAAVEIRYERALDLTRNEDGRLLPVSVTCDAVSGGLVVTDAAHGVLHVFNGAGIETFRTTGFAGLSQPDDGAIDRAGRLLGVTLTDGTHYTLARLDVYGEPDGWTAASPRDDWRPDHVLVARDGNYVTIDGTTGLLAKHDEASGAVMWAKVIAQSEAADGDLEMGLGRPVQLADGSYAIPEATCTASCWLAKMAKSGPRSAASVRRRAGWWRLWPWPKGPAERCWCSTRCATRSWPSGRIRNSSASSVRSAMLRVPSTTRFRWRLTATATSSWRRAIAVACRYSASWLPGPLNRSARPWPGPIGESQSHEAFGRGEDGTYTAGPAGNPAPGPQPVVELFTSRLAGQVNLHLEAHS